jgi:hypothetical protein
VPVVTDLPLAKTVTTPIQMFLWCRCLYINLLFNTTWHKSQAPDNRSPGVTEFFVVVSNICGSAVWKFLTSLPRILKWLLEFFKICVPLIQQHILMLHAFLCYYNIITLFNSQNKQSSSSPLHVSELEVFQL